MIKKLKYPAEICLILSLLALVAVGRANAFFVIITIVLLAALESNNRIWKKAQLANMLLMVLAAVSLWIFNDLMAIGMLVGTVNTISLFNFCIYAALFLFFAGLIRNRKAALLVPGGLLFLVGIVNAVIKAIRRTPISAGDIFSVKTALAVAGNYSMEFDKEFIIKVGAGMVILALTVFIICMYMEQVLLPKSARIVCVGCSVIWFGMMACTSWIVAAGGRNADYFTHETNGFAFNLYLQLKDLSIREPENYGQEVLAEIKEQYPSDRAVAREDYPNIIVIMNESFSDLSVLGEFATNQEVLPFLNSLQDNTIRGNLYSSVYGGNTANTEYEFLTGSSISYFSERVVPFQLYMNEERASVISQMNQLGYQTIFMHPYKAYSWNRPSVYSALQVDAMYYEEDMPKLVNIRGYGSDKSQNEYLIEYLEQQDEPVFLYDVTVQNHGGYTGAVNELDDKITILGQEGIYQETENYLTLIHESDKALEALLAYLTEYEEDTVVLFFGDHQPAIESSFVEMAIGKKISQCTLEDRQKMYTVPFLLWTNFDIEEEYVDKISMNYLSTFLCQELGLPMTGFQKYLTNLYQEFPVINSVCVVDKDNQYLDKNTLTGTQKEAFDEYSMLIYNYMFDKGANLEEFYRLQE